MTDDHANLRPKIVGARIKRTEDPRLLTGAGSFVDDRQAGALAMAFLRSNQAHARIVSIDTTAARAIPGVAAVFTALDIEAQVRPLRATSRMKGYYATPIYPLAHGKVRHVGEIVAAVVAESRYTAEDALEAIAVEYDPLPAATDPHEATTNS